MTRRAQIFFLLYVCAIAYLSLYPGDFLLHPRGNRLSWYPLAGRRQIMDAALNVLFYIPLGVAGVWSFQRKTVGWVVAVAAGIALSGLIEWLQLWSPARFGTLNDLMTNSLGTILGATAALFLRVPTVSGQLAAGPPGVLLIAWFLWHAFPFAPRFSITRLAGILHPEPWSWLTFGELLLGGWALGAALDKPGWRWIAFAILPAQLVLVDHGLSYAALAGGAIGFLAATASRNRSFQILAWALPLWMLFDELRPFALREPVAFSWAPFATWYDAGSEHVYSVLFGKLFLTTATIWCLRQRGFEWWQAVAIPALIVAVGEVAQRWIAGRTPESTDVVLVLIGAILLRLADRARLEGSQLAVKRQESQVESL
jgi:VanZ family protein